MDIKQEYKTVIYNWVKENFGESEADDPSWSIDELARELANHFRDLYWKQELEYLKEDVDYYAENNGYDRLTQKQRYQIADEIRNSDWYCSINAEDMEFYINQELAIAKRKEQSAKNAGHARLNKC